MMTESVQRGCARNAISDFEVTKKLVEDGSKGTVRKHEVTKNPENHTLQDKRHVKRAKRIESSRLNRQWWQRMNLNETYRAPSLFTWRY
ncbi:MAG: hypothetical protein IH838_03905 [Proteobacteria bacterium]|nr:hypothetical protein [Pseudomonadota bacterium]